MHEHRPDGLISAVGFGGFLIILGFLFVVTPNLWQHLTDFANDLTARAVPLGTSTSSIVLPAPAHAAAHHALYQALITFDIAIGVLQVILLSLRLWMHAATRKIADKAGDAVFWLGAAGLVQVLLLQGTLSSWFQFWAALIILIGVTMIVRAFVHFARR